MPNDENATVQAADENTIVLPTIEETEEQEIILLQALLKKGPALPIELAVRTYSFPEDIAKPLANLEQKGLVERQGMKTGEMIVLTQEGHERVLGE